MDVPRLIRYPYWDRLSDIYLYIIAYKIANDGNSPSIINIESETGIVRSQIHKYLRVLHKEGYLKLTHKRGHHIQIVIPNGSWQLNEPQNIQDSGASVKS